MSTGELSAGEARRIALTAQGFGAKRPAKPTLTDVLRVARRLHALQVDTVNVLVRAHYLPIYSRLGPYPIAALDQITNDRHDLIEHLAHQASYMPVALEPLLRWRRDDRGEAWRSAWRSGLDPGYIDAVEQEVIARGPLALSDLEDARRRPKLPASEVGVRRRDGEPYSEASLLWWRGGSDGKTVLDGLLHEGRLALAGRRGVERLYDLTERVLPASVRDAPTPSVEDAHRALVGLAAEALGVATVADLASYFQMKSAQVRGALRDLVAEGSVAEVRVEGWKSPAYLAAGVRAPRRIDVRALLGPFDSLTWSRERTRRLFAFEFSFEIYVPEPKRRYGYYVLPFLLGERLVARVDLKADRQRGVLVVAGAYAEPGVDSVEVASALRDELRRMASWLSLDEVETAPRGDLAPLLA
jgi:uncharacterized protein YcaQ